MQNLFVEENEEFVINFYVAVDSKYVIYCDTERSTLVDLISSTGRNIKDFTIEEYQATFKRPSFGDTMRLYNEIFVVNEDREINFNPVIARCNKIVALIKSWNLRGKEEKPSEIDIKRLHPIVANAIGIQIDFETGGILS